ncbi:Helix-turn-helix domain protein [Anatilimnocola aggregata]|uniref:Helix-turn-helix domain protein n=1 Tax=Anatilimnocola aggregata TaxID=2528021 RepID=A0A517YGA4_9BACT|nr:helix-turn-helix domain-containing protein [Anatilimnocola aggregata]QDU29222.1 Helix-turn-helix domain protein [Anatilimnocola aggregata]
MDDNFFKPAEAAHRLGISVATLYDWLGQSDYGLLEIRGQRVNINYLQGGAKGQGRIRIPAKEVDRLLELMRVTPKRVPQRQLPVPSHALPGITVPLGRPTNS